MTDIEWCQNEDGTKGKTWNPVRGCSRVSSGCDACYAMGQAHRFSGPGKPYEGLTTIRRGKVDWTGVARFIPDALSAPLSWRKPQRIFVNSMSDLFHESLKNEEIAAVFGVMAACPRHTFQVLTKRPERMLAFFRWCRKRGEDGLAMFPDDPSDWRIRQMLNVSARRAGVDMNSDSRQNHGGSWPLKNVWLGVSVEDQKTADERITLLRQLRATWDYHPAVLFVSAEPLLGDLDLTAHLKPTLVTNDGRRLQHPADSDVIPSQGGTWEWGPDWIIVGGESGNGARAFDLAWARRVVAQCREAGTAAFVKQLGRTAYLDETLGDGGPTAQWPGVLHLKSRKGNDMSEWPADLRVREFPKVAP